jgi:hypothetical protein
VAAGNITAAWAKFDNKLTEAEAALRIASTL